MRSGERPERRASPLPRRLVAAALVAAPILLVGWVARKGRGPARQPRGAAPPAAGLPPGDDAALARLFETLAPAARLKAPVVLYDEKLLYEYIDGGAPLYVARHFRRLAAAELDAAGGAELNADVYDMAAPENAAAIFALESSAQARPAPGFDAGRTGPMSLVFRQGRFYVKLTAFDPRGEAALAEVGRAIAARLR
jgi:hypothetical protein